MTHTIAMPAKAPVKKSLWLPLVIGLEITLVTLYAITVLINAGEPSSLLDVNGFRTLPSWLQTTQLFLLGALPLWLAITYRQPKVPPSRNLLVVVGLFFLFASLDELFKLNILFDQHQLWKSIYLSLAVIIPVLFHRDLLRLSRLQPKTMRLIGIGIFIFLAGGFGLELFRRHIQEPYWYQLFGRWKFHQVDAIRTAFEEFGEMLGETLILKGMITLAHWRRAQAEDVEPHSL
ncbi:MAG: hypothetical protein AAGC93_17085 [Cyanobacteria bacterium P01_F01_bin.53]